MMNYYEFGFSKEDEMLEAAINELNVKCDFANGKIYSSGEKIEVTLTGGYTLDVWNSEWGGLNIIHDK